MSRCLRFRSGREEEACVSMTMSLSTQVVKTLKCWRRPDFNRGGGWSTFGCGPGRIAIALIDAEWKGSYLGIEVKSRHVDWATTEITSRFPDYRFIKVDAPNARYNPSGLSPRTLPVQSNSADMICAFSVFSHMLSVDTAAYLGEFQTRPHSRGAGLSHLLHGGRRARRNRESKLAG